MFRKVSQCQCKQFWSVAKSVSLNRLQKPQGSLFLAKHPRVQGSLLKWSHRNPTCWVACIFNIRLQTVNTLICPELHQLIQKWARGGSRAPPPHVSVLAMGTHLTPHTVTAAIGTVSTYYLLPVFDYIIPQILPWVCPQRACHTNWNWKTYKANTVAL